MSTKLCRKCQRADCPHKRGGRSRAAQFNSAYQSMARAHVSRANLVRNGQKKVLDLARALDVSTNPDVLALFDPLLAGFNIWCNPFDHPRGWDNIKMDTGAYAQPCDFVGTCTWGWDGERITHLELSTDAYGLRDAGLLSSRVIHNRPDDVAWCKQKIEWLFKRAGVECPPIRESED